MVGSNSASSSRRPSGSATTLDANSSANFKDARLLKTYAISKLLHYANRAQILSQAEANASDMASHAQSSS